MELVTSDTSWQIVGGRRPRRKDARHVCSSMMWIKAVNCNARIFSGAIKRALFDARLNRRLKETRS